MIPTATVFSSTVNLVKTIVGAGLLAIPYAFRADGVLVALLLIILAAVTSGFGLYLLAKSSKTLLNARQSSFFTLCSISYPRLSLVFDFAMFTQCYGVGLSYLVLVGDLFPGVFGGDRNWWILGSLLVVVPLAHLRQFDSLKYSSFLGLIAITYLVIIIVGAFLEGLFMNDNYQESRGEISWFKIRSVRDLVSTFSIIVFAFTGSMNMFSIINELGDNSMRNINKVIRYSIVVATILFVAVGISGYLTFGSNVVGNVLLNFDESTMRVKFADIALGSMSILSFPLLFHPCRIAFNNMIYYIETNYKQFKLSSKAKTESDPFLSEQDNARVISMSVEDEEDRNVLGLGGGSYQSFRRGSMSHAELSEQIDGEISDVPFDGSRFYLVTWGLLIVLYVLALNVRSFALVLSIVGATGSTAISFILPGLFGYKLIGTESLMKGEPVTKTEQMCKYGSIALVFYGLAVTIISLFVIFYYGI